MAEERRCLGAGAGEGQARAKAAVLAAVRARRVRKGVERAREAFRRAMEDAAPGVEVEFVRGKLAPKFSDDPKGEEDGRTAEAREEQLAKELAWAEAMLARRVEFLTQQATVIQC